MNKALLMAAAVSLSLSGAAFAKGGAKAEAATQAQFTQEECAMLTVESARSACMQSSVRSNGGIDAAAVGASSGQSAMGEGSASVKSAKPKKAKRSKAAVLPDNANPAEYTAPHR